MLDHNGMSHDVTEQRDDEIERLERDADNLSKLPRNFC